MNKPELKTPGEIRKEAAELCRRMHEQACEDSILALMIADAIEEISLVKSS